MQCILTILIFLVILVFLPHAASESKEVVCYYNGLSHYRPGNGKFELKHLDEALHICSYLVYGYAIIEANTYRLILPDELSHPLTNHTRHTINDLKQRFTHLKVLLSVGGGKDFEEQITDVHDTNTKYITLLESEPRRLAFADSVAPVLQRYGFDGLDLAWQFPQTKPQEYNGYFWDYFNYIKTSLFGEEVVDPRSDEHKAQLATLAKELKTAIGQYGLQLTLSVLPNVKHSAYFHPRYLEPYVDLVTLMAFDFYHPVRSPVMADFPAPLYELTERRTEENAEYQITYWLRNSFPKEKIILGIPAFGRAWKIHPDTRFRGSLPVTADGPANPGIFCTEPGLLSYPDICSRLPSPKRLSVPKGTTLEKVPDATRKHGPYAVHVPAFRGEYSFWVGYDDADSAGGKATFAKETNLGGIAIVDITLDDYRGVCDELYPILRAAAFKLRT